MAGKWKKAREHISDIAHWERYGEPLTKYTAKSSFAYVKKDNAKLHRRGTVADIDRRRTVARYWFGESVAQKMWKCSHGKYRYLLPLLHILTIMMASLLLMGMLPAASMYAVGVVWFCLPLYMIVTANVAILERIWRRSVMPWLQIYVSMAEAFAFCDLCRWDSRIVIVAPPMFLSQCLITISDATFFKPNQKNIILMMAIACFSWNLFLLVGVRLNMFPNLHVRDMITVMLTDGGSKITINNAVMFSSKCVSVLVCYFGQIWFRCRHPEMMYSLRSHYTIKRNDKWAKEAGTVRIHKLKKRQDDVEKLKAVL